MVEISYFDKVMSIDTRRELKKNYFCWLYPFTNENIKGYYDKINFNNKKVLCVASSGDHLLNLILHGSRNITAFDSNPLAKMYVELKIGAIKVLSLEEFILFFYNKSRFNIKDEYLNRNIYEKIREVLESYVKLFWDHVFLNYNNKQLYKSFLFTDDFLDLKTLLKVNDYLNDVNYDNLKDLLKYTKIDYLDKNLLELKNANYDIILLSNILGYFDMYFEDKISYFKEIKRILFNLKNKNNIIVVSYLYSRLLNLTNSFGLYDKDNVENILNDNYFYITFDSIEKLKNKLLAKTLSLESDKVLIYK